MPAAADAALLAERPRARFAVSTFAGAAVRVGARPRAVALPRDHGECLRPAAGQRAHSICGASAHRRRATGGPPGGSSIAQAAARRATANGAACGPAPAGFGLLVLLLQLRRRCWLRCKRKHNTRCVALPQEVRAECPHIRTLTQDVHAFPCCVDAARVHAFQSLALAVSASSMPHAAVILVLEFMSGDVLKRVIHRLLARASPLRTHQGLRPWIPAAERCESRSRAVGIPPTRFIAEAATESRRVFWRVQPAAPTSRQHPHQCVTHTLAAAEPLACSRA
jgi:hypothetical protein